MPTSWQLYQLIKEHRVEGKNAITDIAIAKAAYEGSRSRGREYGRAIPDNYNVRPSRRQFVE